LTRPKPWPGWVTRGADWIAWANGSLHHELHGRDDARARSTFLLQILVLAAMGAFIPQAGGARGAAFAVAAAVLFAVLALLWLLAARGDRPEYRRASRLAPPSSWPRRCCSPQACPPGTATAACTGRSSARARRPWRASASAPPARHR
jgi:hypothetical protein